MARRLRDLIVLVPGITGSVLQQNGHDVWAPSWQAASRAILTFGGSLRDLRLEKDDPTIDDLGDGVKASRLVHALHIVPGLIKIFDGYTVIPQLLDQAFHIEPGAVEDDRPTNFMEFPYDWRRDNRVSARKLAAAIDRKLKLWRNAGPEDARVILLAHSMGGLVARYYLEVLEGWRDCRALITFGTPFRGSLDALGYLANGYKKLSLDLTEVMRSFTSVYQLLPIYRAVDAGSGWKRAAETEVRGIDRSRAVSALAFHREIEAAVEAHRKDSEYLAKGYRLIPIVGMRQPTFQSAVLERGRLKLSSELPAWISSLIADGDGTVPRLSAVPIDMSEEYRETFWCERHGALQANRAALDDVVARIGQMQAPHLKEIRGPELAPARERMPAIALDLDDLYLREETVEVRVRLLDVDPQQRPPRALLEQVTAGRAERIERDFDEEAEGWVLRLDGMEPGMYRLEVRTSTAGPAAPQPVHDLFQVAT